MNSIKYRAIQIVCNYIGFPIRKAKVLLNEKLNPSENEFCPLENELKHEMAIRDLRVLKEKHSSPPPKSWPTNTSLYYQILVSLK